MKALLAIIVCGAIAGALLSFFSGDKKKEVAAMAAGGAAYSFGCAMQLLIIGGIVALGLWLFGQVFH